jgi:hypothetical protein
VKSKQLVWQRFRLGWVGGSDEARSIAREGVIFSGPLWAGTASGIRNQNPEIKYKKPTRGRGVKSPSGRAQ